MSESALEIAFQEVERAASLVRERATLPPQIAEPKIAIVLGTGLGGFSDRLTETVTIPYSEIPHFPRPTVEGHAGRLVLGSFAGTPLAVMQGRVHAYEGYTPGQVIFPIRVLGRLGIRTLIVTNAAGGIRADLASGQLVLISDHINFTGNHPLAGPNDARLGQRFFDMSDAYSRRLRRLAHRAAAAQGIPLAEGVYLGLSGPSFETPAEIRAFRTLGADLVGMSTVHEVIAATHLGMEVLGFSSVTNMAAGVLGLPDQPEPIDHAGVLEIGARVQQTLTRVLATLMPLLAEPR
ncbi:MAG TPA: purine-nucleoside phosphorylase [Acidobacteriaceae bacterium]|jgi:purine-nucleoside phosphorylase